MAKISQTDVAEIINIMRDLYISRLMSAVAVTFVLYDWILVFPSEYRTIYQSRWSLAKCLFVYIRVVTPPGIIFGTFQLSDLRPDLPNKFCKAWGVINTYGILTSLCAANGLLTLRLTALYKRKRIVVWFIRVFYFASYAAVVGLCIDGLNTYMGTLYYDKHARQCNSPVHSKSLSGVFFAPSAYEAFVFILTAYSAIKDAEILSGSTGAPFLVMLYRDGIISFIVMVGVRAWNVWIYLKEPLSSYNMGTLFMWAINTVLTTRVYMNLVWLARKPLLSEMTTNARVTAQSRAVRMQLHRTTGYYTDTWIASTYQSDDQIHSIPLDVTNMPFSPAAASSQLSPRGV